MRLIVDLKNMYLFRIYSIDYQFIYKVIKINKI